LGGGFFADHKRRRRLHRLCGGGSGWVRLGWMDLGLLGFRFLSLATL
jgi:hypothetical protein